MIKLLEQSEILKSRVDINFKRYLFDEINCDARLIGIKGARGTGKTTLLLQMLKELSLDETKAVYFSLDDIYFLEHSVSETIRKFYKNGGKYVFLDEVHKYPNWSREIKNIYDQIEDIKIVFTGSSVIDISKQEGDLSRRVLMYELFGLSFREFLKFNNNLDFSSLTLEDLTGINRKNIKERFPNDFRPYEYFKNYLKYGYYPFYKEDINGYYRRIKQVVRLIVEYDMAELKGFDIRNAKKMLQLLQIISQQVPFKPNIVNLAKKSSIHRNSILNYLYFLDQAGIIKLLYPSGISIAKLQKPEKIYLDNTNLIYALSDSNQSTGTIRETFFYNQVRVKHNVSEPKKGDFEVDERFTFEVGGKNKTARQINDLNNAYVVKDELEYPIGNALPVWMFGFLY